MLMKRLFFAAFFSFALARLASSQQFLYQNDGVVTNAPVIDATNFVNNGLFEFNLNSIAVSTNSTAILIVDSILSPFDFSDVQNYTNRNIMSCDNGFIFDTAPSVSGSRHAAANFVNENPGQILGGSANNPLVTGTVIITGVGVPVLKVNSTNVINTGIMDVGTEGLISVVGKTLNLSRGTLHVEGFDELQTSLAGVITVLTGGSLDLGIFANYQGIGLQSNVLSVADFTPPLNQTPIHMVTNELGGALQQSFVIPNALARANVVQTSPSNIAYQIIFVADTLGLTTVDARFEQTGGLFGEPVIQWQATVTNPITRQVMTNSLYLIDDLAQLVQSPLPPNLGLLTNSFGLSGQPLLVPNNFTITRTFGGFNTLSTGNTNFSTVLFNGALNTNGALRSTNVYSALGVNLAPVTFEPDPTLPNSTVSNVAGRIEINATNVLDLTGATITGPNYLRLNSTNHFVGTTNAQIVYPFADINLGSTNGQLTVTNLVAPYIPRYSGPIDAYSAFWTNFTSSNVVTVDTNGMATTNTFTITNTYHVLMVVSALSPTSPVSIESLSLRSTNVTISDAVNMNSNLLINAQSLTITSNSPSSFTPVGQLNLLTPNILWSSSLPILQNLTNLGIITVGNTAYFQKRQNPQFPSPGDGPYQSFVNHLQIATAGGTLIWAGDFENIGSVFGGASITSTIGPVNVQAATGTMVAGSLIASAGDMSLAGGSLTISNHTLRASGALTLSATNLLTDGINGNIGFTNQFAGLTNQLTNVWQVGDGFNLLVNPQNGDLLGTTVNNLCLPNVASPNTWAGIDRGASASGFQNNVGIGHLILDGSNNLSVFHFMAAGAKNALYVDLLELKDGATNRATVDGSQVFTAFNIDNNMTVYYADAIMGNVDISEKLNGTITPNGGMLVWVSSYAGIYSSTNITYPSGITYTFNRALVESQDIDSDGDGIVNGKDPTPINVGGADSINLTIGFTNLPTKAAVVTWQTVGGATNYLYSASNPFATNWTVVTNFVQGPASAKITVIDPMHTNGPSYYKVRIDGMHP